MDIVSKAPDSYASFWSYASQPQRDLLLQGNYLTEMVTKHNGYHFEDYSFLIFPYAKAYEGFLKQVFLDVGFISRLDYISSHLRLGKLLSPNLRYRLGDRSLYGKLQNTSSPELADKIWQTWTVGRNQIFHYYPHNIKSVSFEEASRTIDLIIITMEEAYQILRPQTKKER